MTPAGPATRGQAQNDAHVPPLRVSAVLTHHWLVRHRGGERVLEALRSLLPDAPLYTLVCDPAALDGDWPAVRTSFLQRLPGAARHHTALLPLMPLAYRSIRLPPVDLVVCSDAALAKAMRAHPRSRVVCYCHSPMRYAWDPELAALYRARLPVPLRPLWGPLMAWMRRADRRAAARVDVFVANSAHVARRIARWYGRAAQVVWPPVDLPPGPAPPGPREDFLLCAGHHVPYKRLDLAVRAAALLGRRLVVIGDGPDARRLDRDRPAHVTCIGWQPREALGEWYRRAAALLFPGEEDFGIVPVEAMAHGCPVVAYGRGGACETVVPGLTGALFAPQTAEALAAATAGVLAGRFDPQAMYDHCQQFSRQAFLRRMRAVLEAALSGGAPHRPAGCGAPGGAVQ